MGTKLVDMLNEICGVLSRHSLGMNDVFVEKLEYRSGSNGPSHSSSYIAVTLVS